mgnify:CR=1 FL=1
MIEKDQTFAVLPQKRPVQAVRRPCTGAFPESIIPYADRQWAR